MAVHSHVYPHDLSIHMERLRIIFLDPMIGYYLQRWPSIHMDGQCSALGNATCQSATWIDSCRTQKVQFRATSPIRLRAGHIKTWPAMHSSTRPRHVYACP
jgi:hypothetical protein